LGREVSDYAALHARSVSDPEAFWSELWTFAGVIGEAGDPVLERAGEMPGAQFFPKGRLNFAENVVRRSDDAPAILAETETGATRTISWAELRRDVARVAQALRRHGVHSGDRVAGIVANVPEAMIAALGAATIGAVWSSCSPDFGVDGVLDRFGQIAPVLLVAVDGYRYAGKAHDVIERVEAVARTLPSLRSTVVVPLLADRPNVASIPHAVLWRDWLEAEPDPQPRYERFPFHQPLYILFSSGTTGVPKCIVHGAGGTLVQHLKEHQLHCDIRSDDRVIYVTTCGWMMWNWLVTVLASGATVVLYDGSPFHPRVSRLFEVVDRLQVTLFGTSAKFLDAVRKAGYRPIEHHQFDSLRTITSTGSPLLPESFDFVYASVKQDVHLASISGGTDIVSCFVGGNPAAPVWRGEIQSRILAMDVDVFDSDGRSLALEAGELVCKSPFPSMPVGFWNDPDGAKYRAAYFARFPGVWCHGDWMRFTEHDGAVIFGRSDATLKPGGVRIGTAEIYRQVEQLPEVLESLAVGQRWEGDERIVLFVRLAPGVVLDEGLRKRISDRLRHHASPRHVPARIISVTDIPRTKSGKIVELAVRDVIHGRAVSNREALANPDALDLYRDLPELAR
ncbi:MAG TPA: acetoacetate--CoA ligase, partial [Vicinamibacterales bacterium]